MLKLDRIGQPLGTRLTADQHEERGRGDLLGLVLLAVVQGEGFEVIGSVPVGDFSVQPHGDVGGGPDLPGQIVRHGARQAISPHQHGHLPAYRARCSAARSGEDLMNLTC